MSVSGSYLTVTADAPVGTHYFELSYSYGTLTSYMVVRGCEVTSDSVDTATNSASNCIYSVIDAVISDNAGWNRNSD
jgi:hypothetical protein